jgi:hypothetical protein
MMPKWVKVVRSLTHQYEAARKWAIDYSCDELLHELNEIALQPVLVDGFPIEINGEIIRVPTSQSVAKARLYFDMYKWKTARENLKKYGDRTRH